MFYPIDSARSYSSSSYFHPHRASTSAHIPCRHPHRASVIDSAICPCFCYDCPLLFSSACPVLAPNVAFPNLAPLCVPVLRTVVERNDLITIYYTSPIGSLFRLLRPASPELPSFVPAIAFHVIAAQAALETNVRVGASHDFSLLKFTCCEPAYSFHIIYRAPAHYALIHCTIPCR